MNCLFKSVENGHELPLFRQASTLRHRLGEGYDVAGASDVKTKDHVKVPIFGPS